MAKNKWVKIQTNRALGAYEIIEAVGQLPEPVWPKKPASMLEIIEIAFKNKVIDSYDHPVLKKLRGEL
jgi:hypothetical protein